MKKKTHGGARSKSGRKPIADKAITLAIYPRASWVEILGKERAQQVAKEAVEKAYFEEKNKLS